jgi:hypothetical protein
MKQGVDSVRLVVDCIQKGTDNVPIKWDLRPGRRRPAQIGFGFTWVRVSVADLFVGRI